MDPRLQALLDSVSRLAPRIDVKASAAQARTAFWRAAQRLEAADAPLLHDRRALTVDGGAGPLEARLYTPYAAGHAGPGLVYFHGGGFVMGDLDSHEMLCRRLAASAHIRVLSVHYRLAPENRFPAAVDDAEAASRWVFANAGAIGFDPARIAIGGDSAGGTLTAVAAQALRRDPHCRLAAQLLIYPCTQMVTMTPSQLRFREGYAVTQAAQDFFKDKYLARREDAYDVRCSPLLENDLAGLPRTLCITAGFDPLLDEAKAYADKLAAAGVAVTHRHYPNQPHGFFNMTAVSSAARDAIEETGRWLAQALS